MRHFSLVESAMTLTVFDAMGGTVIVSAKTQKALVDTAAATVDSALESVPEMYVLLMGLTSTSCPCCQMTGSPDDSIAAAKVGSIFCELGSLTNPPMELTWATQTVLF